LIMTTINSCASVTGALPQLQQNPNLSGNANSPEQITATKILELLAQQKQAPKSSCGGGSPVCSGGGSASALNDDDENSAKRKMQELLRRIGCNSAAQPCGAPAQISPCGGAQQPCRT
jgi:hypothetical protein